MGELSFRDQMFGSVHERHRILYDQGDVIAFKRADGSRAVNVITEDKLKGIELRRDGLSGGVLDAAFSKLSAACNPDEARVLALLEDAREAVLSDG